jgi:guanylate kinase
MPQPCVWLWLNEKKIFLIPLSHTHTKIRKKKRQDTKKKEIKRRNTRTHVYLAPNNLLLQSLNDT